MRKLNTHDLFNFARIMKAADLKKELQPLFLKGNKIQKSLKNVRSIEGEEVVNDVEPGEGECIRTFQETDNVESSIRMLGVEIILTIMEACANAGVEEKFYKFIAGPFEMDEKEIAKLSIEGLIEKIQQMAKENNLIYFFNQAANLTN